jgi:enterochelin esterase family protein
MTLLPPVPKEILDAAEAGHDSLLGAIRAAGGSPLQEGLATTFLYVGDADAVGLHHWMDTFPRLPAFTRHPGTELWTLTVELPARSRIEYKLSVKGPGRRRLLLDHLNPLRARDPFGTNSVVTGPLYERPDWTLPKPGVATGTLQTLEVQSATFGDTRRSRLYLPADPGSDPLPLLVAHDGSEYAEYAALSVVLDNLIAAGEVPPLVCVLSDPHDRTREYTGYDQHADHLVNELIPAAAESVALDPDRRVALGASLGGVAALHAAWRHPDVFSGLILQSGSFVTSLGGPHRRGPVFAPVVAFMESFRAHPRPLPELMHLSCGRFDGLAADNRILIRRLEELGIAAAYEEVPDGHNWENWRDRLRAGLVHTFGDTVPPTPGGPR